MDKQKQQGKVKKRGALSWVLEFAGSRRSSYVGSVLLAVLSVLAGFDRTTHQSIPIREEYKQLIREFEGSL